MTRREILQFAGAAALAPRIAGAEARRIAPGTFQPNWESLAQYRAPDWFRDAKFGIWAHWTAQCVPEQGDWYARQMYIQGHPQNNFHVEHYGHPSKFGFMEIDNLWKAEKWEPEALMQLYVKAGAKYFVALANHHDNFDCYDSTHHAWNSVTHRAEEGHRRHLGEGRARARPALRRHQPLRARLALVPDGLRLRPGRRHGRRALRRLHHKGNGKGKWWEGLDPQELYTGATMPMPPGLTTIKAAQDWHDQHDRKWNEEPPPNNPEFVNRWFLRCQDLVDNYHPDLLYFDNTELPLGQAGLDIAAHYYNANMKRHGGKLEAVLNSKGLAPDHTGTMVLDIERGRADKILPAAWQTDTCIGDWHYRRSLFENHRYKTAETVIHMLIDIVSKNGNLLLNIPLRGDGTIDDDERKVLDGLASWIPAHGEALFGTRPFTVYGEGEPDVKGTGNFNERNTRPYTARDIRFTTAKGALYATALAWPADGRVTIQTLAAGSTHFPREVARVEMLGSKAPLKFQRDAAGLTVTMPEQKPNQYAYVLKVLGG